MCANILIKSVLDESTCGTMPDHHDIKKSAFKEEVILEGVLDESIITHSTSINSLEAILNGGRIGTSGDSVSMSKYPRFSFEGRTAYIAFKRPELESHLEKKGIRLHRPLYFLNTAKGKKTNWDGKYGDTFEIRRGGRIKSVKRPVNDFLDKFDSAGLRAEPDYYRDEREITASKGFEFNREHISHIGSHFTVNTPSTKYDKAKVREQSWNEIESCAKAHANTVFDLAKMAASHNLPLKLSVGYEGEDKDDYIKTGTHPHIHDFKDRLRHHMHRLWNISRPLNDHAYLNMHKYSVDELVDNMKVSLGTRYDTHYLRDPNLHSTLRKSALECVEELLSEEIITHSSEIKNLSGILRTGQLDARRDPDVLSAFNMGGSGQTVSFSKFPQFDFGSRAFIAFDRKGLESHNKTTLTRPPYVGPAVGTSRRLPKVDPYQRVLDVGGKARPGVDLMRYSGGLDWEDLEYKREREVRSDKPMGFEPKHVRYLGYHIALHGNERAAHAFDHGEELDQMKALSRRHNIPLRLSIQLHPNHPKYREFMGSGNHADIEQYLGHLSREGHGDLAQNAVRALGTVDDVDKFQKAMHPNLRRTLVGESSAATNILIEAKLHEKRKLFPRPGTEPFRRRVAGFSKSVVPSAVNIQRTAYLDRGGRKELAPAARYRVDQAHNLGLHRMNKPGVRRGVERLSKESAQIRATQQPPLGVGPAHHEYARGLHKKVVRRGVKAGLFKLVPHPDPDQGGRKVLAPGEHLDRYVQLCRQNNDPFHDALEHGVLGADASEHGETMAFHIRDTAHAVHKAYPSGEVNPDSLRASDKATKAVLHDLADSISVTHDKAAFGY